MEVQRGDEDPLPFSFSTEQVPENRAVCWLTYTTEETHRIILENLDRSPIYSGVIEGVGPRYCPSIETKIVRFRDKPRHQLFIEPMGPVWRIRPCHKGRCAFPPATPHRPSFPQSCHRS